MSLVATVNNLIRRHLSQMHLTATRRPAATLTVCFLMFLLSVISIASTRFESDVFQLFPAHSGPLRLLLDTLRWTGSANEAYFLIEGEQSSALVAEAERFARRLRALVIDGRPAFRRVTYRIYDEADAAPFADFVAKAVMLPRFFLPPDQIPAYLHRLTPEGQAAALEHTVTALATNPGIGMTELLTADPLNLRDLILPRLKKGAHSLDLDPTSPYFLSRDQKVLIMIAEPDRSVQDMHFARKLATAIDTARQGASAKISVAGAHVSAAIDEATMKWEILACIGSSLVVVVMLFFLTYRRWLPTLLLPLIIAWGVVLSLGIAGMLLPSVHIIAFAFMALIIGIGTDYSIHLYDRFHLERSTGVHTDIALERACVDTGHSIFTAAVTTAIPFLCLSFAELRALSELGLLVGLGVLATLYATFLFLPPLLLYMERRLPDARYEPLPRFGLPRIWDLTGRHARIVRGTAFIALLYASALVPRIGFEGELKNLQPSHSEAFLTQEKIERHLAISPKQLLVAVDAPDRDSVLRMGAIVDQLAVRYLESNRLTGYSSIGLLFNDDRAQGVVGQALAEQLQGRDLTVELKKGLNRAGFAVAPFSTFLDGIGRLGTTKPQSASVAIDLIAASPLKGVVNRHLFHDEAGYHLLSYLHYRGEEFPVTSFLSDLISLVPTARATSIDLVSRQLTEQVRQSFLWSAVISGILVLFLFFSHFSSFIGIVTTLFPVLAGVVVMLALMAGFCIKLNFMNVIVLVTILGMGSDYGMHIAHRTWGVAVHQQCDAYVQSGRAVLLSALTTIAGFGSLAFADYGALATLGWATNFGIGATAIFALVVIPAFRRAGGAP